MIHRRGYHIWARHWPLAAIQERILFNPVHQEETQNAKRGDDRLERHEETDEEIVADHVDILHADLELHLFAHLVQLKLAQPQSPNYIT